jgi:osmotically-inducible protein OsmY
MKLFNFISPAALLVTAALVTGCAGSANRASTGEVIDDTVITARVKAAFIEDPELAANEINVETFKGVVQLSGFVSESSDISKATQVAREVPGVASVRNDIVAR